MLRPSLISAYPSSPDVSGTVSIMPVVLLHRRSMTMNVVPKDVAIGVLAAVLVLYAIASILYIKHLRKSKKPA